MSDDSEYLTEVEAGKLWHRAAQLQAEAAKRAEAEAEQEAVAEIAGGPDDTEGYALTHVRAAALEAGIPSEFVDAALADVRAERSLPSGSRGMLSRAVLQDPPDALIARRVIEAPATKVLGAMETVFPVDPYGLSLVDREGDPLNGGLMVFNINGSVFGATEGFAGDANWADFRQVYATLQPLGGDRPTCEVTLRAPLTSWSYPLNTAGAGFFTSVGGAIGFGGGMGLGTAIVTMAGFGGVPGVLAGLVVAIGAAAGGRLGLGGYRTMYGYSLRRGTKALEGLLGAIALRAEGGFGLGGSARGALQPGDEPGDVGSATT